MVSYLDLASIAPAPEPTVGEVENDPDELVFAAVEKIVADIGEANVRAVEAVVPIRKGEVGHALERLKLRGRLIEKSGPRNARLFIPSPDAVSEDAA